MIVPRDRERTHRASMKAAEKRDDRVASVHAESDLRCASMMTWNFRPFVKAHPDVAWALLTALVKRVRENGQQAILELRGNLDIA